MSTKRFPRRRPVDDPPLPEGRRVDNLPTPAYVLAWVCKRRDFYINIGGETGKANSCNFSTVIDTRWEPAPGLNSMPPLAYPAPYDNVCLIVMWNTEAEDINRARHPTEDPVVQAARVAVGVDEDPSLDKTLQWLRWPLDWFTLKEYARMMAESEGNRDGDLFSLVRPAAHQTSWLTKPRPSLPFAAKKLAGSASRSGICRISIWTHATLLIQARAAPRGPYAVLGNCDWYNQAPHILDEVLTSQFSRNYDHFVSVQPEDWLPKSATPLAKARCSGYTVKKRLYGLRIVSLNTRP
ncbi:hypothetical protein B0H12DRAFT_1082820 [Mycena haematopus]|nr:hypothetical protein B0H12DRAFT_1082820 [Mycena haematopus]